MTRRRGLLLVSCALTASLLVLGVVVQSVRARADRPSAPPWQGGSVPCRSDPLGSVHHPTRVELVKDCATVGGVVRSLSWVRAYGDLEITIEPYARYSPYLLPGNHGLLVVDVVADDQPLLPRPRVQELGVFEGSWVIDRATGAAKMLPTWSVSIAGRPGRLAMDTLQVSVFAPAGVTIGSPLPVFVEVQRLNARREIPVQQVHLFVELATNHHGVDWRAGLTNSLGLETFRFLALDLSGVYTISVHAVKGARLGVATTTVEIHRA